MTTGEIYGNIDELSRSEREVKRKKKVLTERLGCDRIQKIPKRESGLKKLEKKMLTRASGCGIIIRLSR